jgi:hypothetical protein
MLSALPKLADKAFIFGFFLPALLFAFACLVLFADLSPFSDVLQSISAKESFEKLVYMTLAVWVLSILLLICNHIEYQVLEGYLWPLNSVKKFQTKERDRFVSKKIRFEELNNEWRKMGDDFPIEDRRKCNLLERELVKNFPMQEEYLLPTRFGNAIRAFEVYSSEVYGADSVPLWPHLTTVMSKEMKVELDGARAQVDFLVNICCFAALVSLIAVARLIFHIVTLGPPWIDGAKLITSTSLIFGLFALGGTVVCIFAYRWSIQQIYIWGAIVKAAFDCYLPALASKLGYKLPEMENDQRKFWIAVSERAIYHRSMPSGPWSRIQEEDEGHRSTTNGEVPTTETTQPDQERQSDDDD